MHTYRFVRMIETHSEELATALLEATRASNRTAQYVSKVDDDDLKAKVHDIYKHLGEWLTAKSEADVEKRYLEIGRLRAQQGVPLSQLLWAIMLVKDTLIEFLKKESVTDAPFEVFGELQMLQALEQFFDHALYFAALGHEHAPAKQPASV
jgi:hypothetical protein